MKAVMVTVILNYTNATTRAFLDCGSSRTYITEEFLNILKLKSTEYHNFYVSTFGNTKQIEKSLPTVNMVMKTKFRQA